MADTLRQSFVRLVGTKYRQILGTVVSTGGSNGGDIVALDDSGHLDPSVLPTGIGADTEVWVTSEALSAGDLVNIYDASGTSKARKADATTEGKEAWGFVNASVTSGGNATVYFAGENTGVSGLTAGEQFLATTAGTSDETAPTGSGNVVQSVGQATASGTLMFTRGLPTTLA